MYRIAGSCLPLIATVSLCSLPAFALAPPGTDALAADHRAGDVGAEICEVEAQIDYPMLLAAYSGEFPNGADTRSSADARKALPNEPGDSGTDSAGETMLSLMQSGPRTPQVAARTVDNERPEDWMRTAERPIPEPGLWAVLIAGFLGVCAMARRRIFST